MTFKTPAIVFLSVIITSCNNQPKDPASSPSLIRADGTNCYSYINNKDTVRLKTIVAKDEVTGTLMYNYFEKDKNTGIIQGKIKGDLLIADYIFRSEGMTSTRQVIFKKDKDTYTEGYGEMEELHSKLSFRNIDSINFSNNVILKKADCER